MKKLSYSVFIFLFLVFACNNSEKSTTQKMLEVGETLLKVIDEFEQARGKMMQVVSDFATNIEKYVTENPKNIAQTADKWEKDWNVVAEQIKELENKYNNVEKNSNTYFNQLYALTDNIQNHDLRESEEKKNKELRSHWDVVTSEANADMEKIRSILKEGNDFKNVLMSSAIRAKIDDNITQIKGISRKAKDILSALSKFSIDGKKVIRGEKVALKTPKQETKKEAENEKNIKETERTNGVVENNLIEEVTASSFLKDNSTQYRPENVIDYNLQTWWSPSSSENYKDEWLLFQLKSSQNIQAVQILNGSYYPDYPKMGDIFKKNYRVKTIQLTFDDDESEIVSLEDTQKTQKITLKKTYKAKKIKLTILEVYPSEKWKDVCISHFAFLS